MSSVEELRVELMAEIARSGQDLTQKPLKPLSLNYLTASEQAAVFDLDDRMEGMRQTSFMDLHGIAITQVMKKLDVRSLLAMRLVNKRMDKLHFQVKYLQRIHLEINSIRYELKVELLNGLIEATKSDNFEDLMNRLQELYLHRVHSIYFSTEYTSDKKVRRLLDAFSNFHADKLIVGYSSLIDLPILLAFAQKITIVCIGCTPLLSTDDLWTLRKTMLEGGCKMEKFTAQVGSKPTAFVEKYFGITFEAGWDDYDRSTMTYSTTDESVELYLEDDFISGMSHFEGGLMTKVDEVMFTLKKCNIDQKSDPKYKKIEMGRVYTWEY